MRPLHLLAFTLLLACALPAFAQEPAAQAPIEQQMTPEQFKAAGLDKLSAEELANLNAWLNKTLETETTKAAALAKDKVEDEARGFLSFGSDEAIVSRLVGEFDGFGEDKVYTLENGQQWRQTNSARLEGVHVTNPEVRIRPGVLGVWYMKVDGYNTSAKVQRIK